MGGTDDDSQCNCNSISFDLTSQSLFTIVTARDHFPTLKSIEYVKLTNEVGRNANDGQCK